MATSTERTYVGVEIGGTKLQIVAADEELRIGRRWRGMVDRERGAEGIREQLAGGLKEVLGGAAVAGIGVGFGGPIDWRSGRIDRSHQIEGWNGFELGEWFAETGGAPVAVDNDANVAALGEALAGAGVGVSPVFYVTLGSGVGGGVVVNERIYHGAPPGEVEFGHVRLDRSGATVEKRCCGWAIDARIRELKKTSPESALCRMIGEKSGGEARHLSAAVAQGDPAATRILRELCEDLAFGLSHAVHFFHPSIIIFGGGLSMVGDVLTKGVADQLPRFLMETFRPGPPVVLAKLGEDAVPVGALRLARKAEAQHELEEQLIEGLNSGSAGGMTADAWQDLRRKLDERIKARKHTAE